MGPHEGGQLGSPVQWGSYSLRCPGHRHILDSAEVCRAGVVCSGSDPSWKCICTLSGFHSRTIYDVAW